jgi:hypothetical protein
MPSSLLKLIKNELHEVVDETVVVIWDDQWAAETNDQVDSVIETTETVVEITTVETVAETTGILVDPPADSTTDQPADSTKETTEDHETVGVIWDDQWAAETNDQVDSVTDQAPDIPKTDHLDSAAETMRHDDQWAVKIDHSDSVIDQEAATTHQLETTVQFEAVHEAAPETSDLTTFEAAIETARPVDSATDQGAAMTHHSDETTAQFEAVHEAAPETSDLTTFEAVTETLQLTDSVIETVHHVTLVQVTTHQGGDDSLVKNQRNPGQHHLLNNNQLKNKAHQLQPLVHLITKGVLMSVMDGLKFKCDKNGIKR